MHGDTRRVGQTDRQVMQGKFSPIDSLGTYRARDPCSPSFHVPSVPQMPVSDGQRRDSDVDREETERDAEVCGRGNQLWLISPVPSHTWQVVRPVVLQSPQPLPLQVSHLIEPWPWQVGHCIALDLFGGERRGAGGMDGRYGIRSRWVVGGGDGQGEVGFGKMA
ncbi:hypothetical protein P280DRAFT_469592 [Massarina eburnea CBS 473.64]|uniref:Uncharacterized protein n=1 Tax=Massarina eburnea CBS 473.64 TaxID=1395130 RepID=A0A6A6S067_9PLEO|nr:hypothetical protein P280DRAFT_469592 [Massarina eburnea CBS 473.64]